MSGKRTKPGRPGREPAEGERVGLSLRVTADTKRVLDAAAEASGRSLSQEAEFWLELSMGGNEARPVTMIMAATFLRAGRSAARERSHADWTDADWMADPECFEKASFAVWNALWSMHPRPDAPFQPRELWDESMKGRRVSQQINAAARKRRSAS